MTKPPAAGVLRYIRRLITPAESDGQDDDQLLQRFVRLRDETAFAVLVQRHGAMVFGVCRQVLSQTQDAEDAFQATFLVLARKAAAIRERASLAAWLHRVAVNIARTARLRAARRQNHERQAATMSSGSFAETDPAGDWQPLLHEEVNRLPEKYRAPVVLCYLDGKTSGEAARQLGWPVGTVKGRLARARDLLRARLARRGFALAGGSVAVALSQAKASAGVPAALVTATVQTASLTVAGAAGMISARVAVLMEGELKTMLLTRLKIVAAVLLAIGVLAGVVGTTVYQTLAATAAGASTPGGAAADPVKRKVALQEKGVVVATNRPAQQGAAKQGKKVQNIPAILQASEPVQVKDLAFQVVTNRVWPVPGPGGISPVQLQLRATNRGMNKVPFLPILGMPILTTADGMPLKAQMHGADHIRRLPNAVLLESGQAGRATETARLIQRDKGLAIYWEDSGGSVWSYEGLKPGKYLLHLHYTSTGPKGTWAGEVHTKAVTVEIQALQASAPVVANQIEVCALADGTWQVPAAGTPGFVSLGFRVTKRQKPNWARIIPRIAALSLKAPDGGELPMKKVAVVAPDGVPLALHMEPDVSRTLTESAQLRRAGRSLALTWVDSNGSVWQVEGLRPGKYAVHYLIQAESGRTPGDWTTWTGEVQTAAVEVTIKE